MTGNEYQALAMRTNDKHSGDRLLNELTHKSICGNFESIGGLLNGVLGLTGEAGEVSDLVKKGIFHEKGIDQEHFKKEFGDVMWYVDMICQSCGFDLDEIMELNVEKLKARYPEGFDTYLANHKKDGDI